MYIKDWYFTVTLYIFTDCWNSIRYSRKLMKKLVRRFNTLSVRWFWWHFQKDRNSISIWKLDRKMRKISIVEKVNFTWFCKGNSFRKIKEKPTFGKLDFSPFSIEFFHLTIKFSYGFQNSKRFENVHFNFYYDENCYKPFFFVKMRNTTKTRFFFLYTLKTLRFFDFVNMKNASKCFFIWQKRNNAWKTCFHFVTIKNTSKTCFSIL